MKPSKTRANTLTKATADDQDLDSICFPLRGWSCDRGEKTPRKDGSNPRCAPMWSKQKRAPGTSADLIVTVEAPATEGFRNLEN